MPQGFRFCTAKADTLEIISLHHTRVQASRAALRPTPPLRMFSFPRPWALAKGDIVPPAGVEQVPSPPPKRQRKPRLGE